LIYHYEILWHTPCHGDAHATLINLSTLDREALQALVLRAQQREQAHSREVAQRDNEIKHLKAGLAKLRRMIALRPTNYLFADCRWRALLS
jgi:hypothetical protein